MQASEASRAIAAAMSVASSRGLAAGDAIVLHDSNRLTVRLLPCDVLARVAPAAHQVARFEVELAQRLAGSGCPVAAVAGRSNSTSPMRARRGQRALSGCRSRLAARLPDPGAGDDHDVALGSRR